MHVLYGFTAGVFVGGFLAYKYADVLVAKALREYQKAKELEQRIAKAL